MAINKEKNQSLQITLSKSDYEKLEQIQANLSASLGFDLTKSQIISYLIRELVKDTEKIKPLTNNKKPKNTAKTPRKTEYLSEYADLIQNLKNKLNMSYSELGELLNIPSGTLKKYGNGQRTPKRENLVIINDALKKYGIVE